MTELRIKCPLQNLQVLTTTLIPLLFTIPTDHKIKILMLVRFFKNLTLFGELVHTTLKEIVNHFIVNPNIN